MSKNIRRTVCIVLALLLTIGLFAGCSKGPAVYSIYSYYDADDDVADNNNQDTQQGADNNAQTNNAQTNSGGGNKTPSGSSGGSKNTVTKKNGIEFLVNPDDYRGTTVTYVTWRDPKENEDGDAIAKFESKYGIKVKVQLTAEDTYTSTIVSNIAAGTQGDVFFQNNSFPASLAIMQPLDAAKLNYKDPIWRQEVLEVSKIDGRPYFVDTIGNVWSELNICIYNKSIFENNGLTTPTEYYEAGNWTFETFEKAAREVAALGKGYIGAALTGDALIGATGSGIYTYSNNKFSLTITDKIYSTLQRLSQLKADGVIEGAWSVFGKGKTGMCLTDCFGLKRSGYWPSMNSSDIAATYLPRFDKNSQQVKVGIFRGWGLIRGAKNPEAAGIFLREYLDANNYNLDKTFHNEEVKNFFFEVTGTKLSNMVYNFSAGITTANGKRDDESGIERCWFEHGPSEVRAYVESQLNTQKNLVNNANKVINTQREYFKKNY